jgi:conjugal transfer pilus assembly protein TrbC
MPVTAGPATGRGRLPGQASDRIGQRAITAAAALAGIALASAGTAAHAQSMAESMQKGWSTYIFVSLKMPQRSLIELAREASLANATLVLRGGQGGDAFDTAMIQRTIVAINQACCAERPAAWILDPVLADRYHVTAAPTFVVAWSTGGAANQFASVSGDMSLANALKFVAQGSTIPAMREQAKAIYVATYGGRP